MGQRDEYVSAIKSAAVSMGTNALFAMLVAEVPIFANPILAYIAKAVINEVLTKLINGAEFGAFYLFIDFRTSQEGRDFYDAAKKLVNAKLKGTPEEKANAEKHVTDTFSRLVVLTA